MTSNKISFDELLYNFFREVTDADIAMQLNQIDMWQKAAKQPPYLYSYEKSVSGGQQKEQTGHIISDLIEGVDHQNNLAINEVTLEFYVVKCRAPFFSWLRDIFRKKKAVYYKLASPGTTSVKPCIKLNLKAQRRPVGSWELSTDARKLPEEIHQGTFPAII